MGKRDSYEPGTFCWVDLATTDTEVARSFYGELFGWESEVLLASEGFTYTMMQIADDTVCGIYDKGEERRSRGIPPYWLSYVSVEDVVETAAKVNGLGGTVIEEPYGDDAGLMSVISDPEGAMFVAYQPKTHIGASRVNDAGCFTWNELQTRKPETASEFYSGLFGWEMKPIEQDNSVVYVTIGNKGSENGGMMPMTEQHGDTPPSWLTYFTTFDVDASVEKIKNLGGGVMAGPMEVTPGSRIAVVHDPQGATFALFEGEVDN